MKKELIWSYRYRNYSDDGLRITYRCNSTKSRGVQCAARVSLLYHSDSTDISFYRSVAEHNHESDAVELVFKFSPAAEKLITESFRKKMKPKSIRAALVKEGFGLPPKAKPDSFLKKLRAAAYGPKLNMGSLEAWLLLSRDSPPPEDDCEPFVIDFEVDCGMESQDFRFVRLNSNYYISEQ